MAQINKSYNTLSAKSFNVTGDFKVDGTQVTATASELNILDGVTATAAELNLNDNQVAGATFTIGSEAADVINVGIQLTDAAGSDMATRAGVDFYLSDSATGDTVVAAATSLAIGTDGVAIEYVSNSAGKLISEADGDIDLDIGDASGAATYYLVLLMPNGSLVVSDAITFAA